MATTAKQLGALLALGGLLGSPVGCTPSNPPPAGRAQPPFETFEELGYRVEYEYDPAAAHSHHASKNWVDPADEDAGAREYVGVVVRGVYVLRIIDGRVTLNDRPRGTLRKGDHLKVTRDLRVWVNGSEVRK